MFNLLLDATSVAVVPEVFLRVSGRAIMTSPMANGRHTAQVPAIDHELEAKLASFNQVLASTSRLSNLALSVPFST